MGVKISDLPQANTSTNSDLFAIVQAGETKKVNKSVVVESVNNNIANEYSTASTYNVGDMCIYQGNLYVCVTAITTAEEWNATNWQRITMGEQLVEQITELNNNKLDKTQILNSQSTSTTDSYSANYVNGLNEIKTVNYADYITITDTTMTMDTTFAYKIGNFVVVGIGAYGRTSAFAMGETIVGSCSNKLVATMYGDARVSKGGAGVTSAAPATLIAIPNGDFRVVVSDADKDSFFGTVILLVND